MKYIAVAVLAGILFNSCDLADQKANRLHNGTGVWMIEQLQITEFDSSGSTLRDSVVESPGELIFFSTGSLSALFDYYQGIYIDYGPDTIARSSNPMEYYIDAKRVQLRMSYDPMNIGSVMYNVEKFGKSRQEWVYSEYDENYAGLVKTRRKLYLRKNKSFKD